MVSRGDGGLESKEMGACGVGRLVYKKTKEKGMSFRGDMLGDWGKVGEGEWEWICYISLYICMKFSRMRKISSTLPCTHISMHMTIQCLIKENYNQNKTPNQNTQSFCFH